MTVIGITIKAAEKPEYPKLILSFGRRNFKANKSGFSKLTNFGKLIIYLQDVTFYVDQDFDVDALAKLPEIWPLRIKYSDQMHGTLFSFHND